MDVSFQLYSARNFPPWDGVVKTLAGLGYTQVEGFAPVYSDPSAFRATLDACGLSMPAGHFFPLNLLEDDFAASRDAARTLGMNRLFCPAPDEGLREGAGAADWTALARRLEEIAKRLNDSGLAFGWHNHHWEFMDLPGGGIAMDLILEHAPSVDWEIDAAWVARAGADPLRWIAAHGERITTAHVKDIAPEGENADEDGWADVGHGVMDWKAITQALIGAGVDHFAMEHDNPSDLHRFAARSIEAFRSYRET